MALDFTQVQAAIDQTKVEVAESDAAQEALDAAKATLTGVQTQLTEAQAAVAAASAEAGTQKADVVNGINAAISALQELLQQLQ